MSASLVIYLIIAVAVLLVIAYAIAIYVSCSFIGHCLCYRNLCKETQ